MTSPLIRDQWRKSSYSNGAGGECVEVAATGAAKVGIRDSKVPLGPHIAVQLGAWDLFVGALRHHGVGGRLGA
ncbi:DUF397 domain-containing protein [Streptomyces sp. NPDC087851]|uniref:DUF397 domain-containing protein n=1 Tax=Streptomyces sp. NPDC087851 TaxID=3365810 RepID=UPI0037FDE423